MKRAKGELRIKAVAWYEPGKVDGQMRKGEGDNLWGGLRGRMGHKAVPAGARTITRKAVAKWAKGGTVEWTLGAAKVKGGQVLEASGDSEGGDGGGGYALPRSLSGGGGGTSFVIASKHL